MGSLKVKLLIGLLLLFCSIDSVAQTKIRKWCSVGDINVIPIDRIIDSKETPKNTSRLISPSSVIVIPVVFHILYHTGVPEENIADAVIHSQIDRLNKDCRKLNTDVTLLPPEWQLVAADLRFEFKLACIAPDGSPTTGIVRKVTTNNIEFCGLNGGNFCYDSKLSILGGDNAWPTDKYLNIWVCDMEGDGGLAMLPDQRFGTSIVNINGNPVLYQNSYFDGIVMDYTTVGDPSLSSYFTKGRVAAHEVGHWLGLHHPYLGNCLGSGDYVDDTPPQQQPYFFCPNYPLTDGCSNNSPGVMFMNYMNHTQDDCKYMFTNGQKNRCRSYYDQNGPLGTRFPFLDNYFSIREFGAGTLQVINNTVTIEINNPACLQVSYNYSGPVFEISRSDHQIVFSVPCNSNGAITLTAIATNNFSVSGNIEPSYIDDYTFNYQNQAQCDVWPKKYFWNDPDLFPTSNSDFSTVTKGKNGNLFYSIGSVSFNNNFNHTGAMPASNNSQFLVHYNSSGTTNWVRDNLTNTGDVFIMENGSVRTKITTVSPDYIYINEATGNITNGPNYVPNDEKILAETVTGVYITYKNGQLFVRSPTTTTSMSQNVEYSIFNKNTNRLFVQESVTNDFPASGVIKIYSLINGNLTPASNNIPSIQGHLLYHVDNNDNVYTLDWQCGSLPIYKFEYSTSIYAPLTLPNFINNTILPFKRRDHLDQPYASDVFAVITPNPNQNGRITNIINITNNSCKKITGTSNANWSCSAALGWGFNNYIIDGDNIYMAGNIFANIGNDIPVVIGQQVITSLPPISFTKHTNYLAKFSISGDFDRANQTVTSENVVYTFNKNFDVNLYPNPATNILSIKINQAQTKNAVTGFYRVSITDKFGIQVLQTVSSQPLINQEVSSLPLGVYLVIVTSPIGEKVTKSFIKQ